MKTNQSESQEIDTIDQEEVNGFETGEEFFTSDLPLAAFLIVYGVRFLRARPGKRGRAYFVFKESSNRAKLTADFLGSKAAVIALEYLEAIRMLKGAAEECNTLYVFKPIWTLSAES